MSHQASPSSQDAAGFEFQRRRKDKGKEKEKPTEEGGAMTAQDILRATGNAAAAALSEGEEGVSEESQAEIPDEGDARILHNLDRVASLMAGADPSSVGPEPLDLRLSSIRIQGSRNVRSGFLSSICRPYVDPSLHSSPLLASLLYTNSRLNFTTDHGTPRSVSDLLRLATLVGTDLTRFDLFSEVTATLEPTRNPLGTQEDVDVVLNVKEKSRVFLKSSTDVGNGEGSASVQGKLRNLAGGAETLEGSCTFGTRTKRALHLVLSTPVLASPDHTLSLSGFASDKDCTGFASSYERTQGGRVALTSNFALGSQHEFAYEAAYRNLSRMLPDASISIRKLAKPSVKTSLTHNWTFDTRDDPVNGTMGYLARIKSEFASCSFGGDTSFFKGEIEGQTSRSFGKGFAWSIATKVGLVRSLDSRPIPFSDRFQLGGPTDVRMFRMNTLGPKDYGDSLGGDAFWALGLSLFSPIPKKEHWPVKLHGFFNAGQLTQIDQSSSLGLSSLSPLVQPSSSAGLGLMYRQGALRIELNAGLPLTARIGDGTRKGLQLGLGISFL